MGLIRGMAKTAVVAGTATAVSNNVSRRQARKWSNEDQGSAAVQDSGAQVDQDDAVEQVQKLAELKDQGILTQQEFDAKKKQLLGL